MWKFSKGLISIILKRKSLTCLCSFFLGFKMYIFKIRFVDLFQCSYHKNYELWVLLLIKVTYWYVRQRNYRIQPTKWIRENLAYIQTNVHFILTLILFETISFNKFILTICDSKWWLIIESTSIWTLKQNWNQNLGRLDLFFFFFLVDKEVISANLNCCFHWTLLWVGWTQKSEHISQFHCSPILQESWLIKIGLLQNAGSD